MSVMVKKFDKLELKRLICDIVRPLTKYTKFISKKENFLPELIKAIKISKKDRPGPVWLDVALDIQWSDIKFKKEKKINI